MRPFKKIKSLITALEQNRKSREQTIRALAGWLTHAEAAELREAVEVFNQIQKGKWE